MWEEPAIEEEMIGGGVWGGGCDGAELEFWVVVGVLGWRAREGEIVAGAGLDPAGFHGGRCRLGECEVPWKIHIHIYMQEVMRLSDATKD